MKLECDHRFSCFELSAKEPARRSATSEWAVHERKWSPLWNVAALLTSLYLLRSACWSPSYFCCHNFCCHNFCRHNFCHNFSCNFYCHNFYCNFCCRNFCCNWFLLLLLMPLFFAAFIDAYFCHYFCCLFLPLFCCLYFYHCNCLCIADYCISYSCCISFLL